MRYRDGEGVAGYGDPDILRFKVFLFFLYPTSLSTSDGPSEKVKVTDGMATDATKVAHAPLSHCSVTWWDSMEVQPEVEASGACGEN